MMKYQRAGSQIQRCGISEPPAEQIYILSLQVCLVSPGSDSGSGAAAIRPTVCFHLGLSRKDRAGFTGHLFCRIRQQTSLIWTGQTGFLGTVVFI